MTPLPVRSARPGSPEEDCGLCVRPLHAQAASFSLFPTPFLPLKML